MKPLEFENVLHYLRLIDDEFLHEFSRTILTETFFQNKFSSAGKMVIQLSKKSSESVLAFASLGPTHLSSNMIEGKRECAIFFPEDYDEPEPEEEVVEQKPKKKKKGAKKAKPKPEEVVEEEQVGEEEVPEDVDEEEADEEEDDVDDVDVEDESHEQSSVAIGEPLSEIGGVEGADKATSPVGEEIVAQAS